MAKKASDSSMQGGMQVALSGHGSGRRRSTGAERGQAWLQRHFISIASKGVAMRKTLQRTEQRMGHRSAFMWLALLVALLGRSGAVSAADLTFGLIYTGPIGAYGS